MFNIPCLFAADVKVTSGKAAFISFRSFSAIRNTELVKHALVTAGGERDVFFVNPPWGPLHISRVTFKDCYRCTKKWRMKWPVQYNCKTLFLFLTKCLFECLQCKTAGVSCNHMQLIKAAAALQVEYATKSNTNQKTNFNIGVKMSSSTDMDKSQWGNDILWKSLHWYSSSIQNKQQDLISASHVKLIQRAKTM